MLHATTVPASAQVSWPTWWKTSGMTVNVAVGDIKPLAFVIPASVDMDAVSSRLAVGDSIQYGGEKITITEVYKAGFTFDKADYPKGNVKAGTLVIFYKSDTGDPYTMQAVAVATTLGLRLQDTIDAKNAILPVSVKETPPPKDSVITVTPTGSGLPDTINQLSQFAIIGGLVVLGIMAFQRYAR